MTLYVKPAGCHPRLPAITFEINAPRKTSASIRPERGQPCPRKPRSRHSRARLAALHSLRPRSLQAGDLRVLLFERLALEHRHSYVFQLDTLRVTDLKTFRGGNLHVLQDHVGNATFRQTDNRSRRLRTRRRQIADADVPIRWNFFGNLRRLVRDRRLVGVA